ncbi:MAG: discoidin domain-containing protein [Brevundimonas sp.]
MTPVPRPGSSAPALGRRPAGRIAVAALAALAVVISLAAVRADEAHAATTVVLSQGKPTTASSVESAATPATSATDGDAGTRWSSSFADNQWIQVDLGATKQIAGFDLTWEAAYASKYTIATSNDGTTWTTVVNGTATSPAKQSLTATASGRYVRLTGTQRATAYGTSLFEFQVLGSSDPQPTTLLSKGKPTTASSTESAATPASSATDGDLGTRWSSAFSVPQWIQVDLGTSSALSRVDLTWETAYATAFTIQSSSDGQTWSTIATQTAATGGKQSLPVSGTGRYVRLNATAKNTGYGISLWELEVFGTGGTTTPTPTSTPTSTPTQDPGGAVLLSYKKPGTASSSQDDGTCYQCTADKALDYDAASRWASANPAGWTDAGWIQVDLGAPAHVTKVVLQWDPAYATGYQVQVSPDGNAWSTIYTTTTGKGFKETLNVTGDGRYVRLNLTKRSGPYGYSLYAFDVYGTGGNPVQPPTANLPAPNFTRLAWSDEFNGAAGSGPDASKWTVDAGTGQNGEQQYYTPTGNLNMDGQGHLVIEARKQASGGRDYTSGRMNTSNKFMFTYGRVEARIKVPTGQGYWPAFWMMGADFLTGRPWPYNGEVDIMEVLGKDTTTSYSTLHAPAYNGAGGYGGSYKLPNGAPLSDDFHTWAAEWDANGIRYYLDNRLVFTADKATVESTRGPWIYDHDFYVILNLAVGGDWPGPVDATTPFPAKMLVDYVRVYR